MATDPERKSTATGDARAQRLVRVRRTLLVVLFLNLGVAVAKLGFGYWSGSVAMRADGVQSLLDSLANVVALISVAIAQRPPDEEHHFGHDRYETLASLLIAGLMSVGVIQILQEAVTHLRQGSSPDVSALTFGVMFATMTVNAGVAAWERRVGGQTGSDVLIADAKHTASDVLVSLSVILGLTLVSLGWTNADAVISIAITVLIAWTAWTIVRDASRVLTDATGVDPRNIMRAVLATEGVRSAHKLRARSSGGRLLAQVDIAVEPTMTVLDAHDIASQVERSIKDVAGEESQVVVHVEPAIGRHTRPDLLFGDVRADNIEQ